MKSISRKTQIKVYHFVKKVEIGQQLILCELRLFYTENDSAKFFCGQLGNCYMICAIQFHKRRVLNWFFSHGPFVLLTCVHILVVFIGSVNNIVRLFNNFLHGIFFVFKYFTKAFHIFVVLFVILLILYLLSDTIYQ